MAKPSSTLDYESKVKGEVVGPDRVAVAAGLFGAVAVSFVGLGIALGSAIAVLAVPFAFFALLFGVAGLFRTRRIRRVRLERFDEPRKGSAFAVFGMMIGLLLVVAMFLLPTLGRARESANRVKCGSNLRQIGQAIVQYSLEHPDAVVPDIATLIQETDAVPAVFLCPSGTEVEGQPPFKLGDTTSYHLFGDRLNVPLNALPLNGIIGFCQPNHHQADVDDTVSDSGTNVLYADGSVRFVSLEELSTLLVDAAARKR
jgi:prepilin-type processing-associated H-X9-DG protein